MVDPNVGGICEMLRKTRSVTTPTLSKTRYMDCAQEPLPYGGQLVNDILNRTDTAMSQAHCFLATELSLLAQKRAAVLNLNK